MSNELSEHDKIGAILFEYDGVYSGPVSYTHLTLPTNREE